MAADSLANVRLVREKKLLANYFGEIAKDSGMCGCSYCSSNCCVGIFCFGVKDTLQALEMGAVEELIVWEDLAMNRYVLRNKESGGENC